MKEPAYRRGWKYIVWVDGFPYKKYQSLSGANLFVKRLSKEDKATHEIIVKKHD